jgi:MATE family multidrug resistance protein
MDQPDAVVELTIPYFRVLNLSLIPLMIFQTSKQFAEGLSLTRYAMYVSLGANILNVLFNYLLIFGNLGFPKMGVMGAGWATLSARIIMATAMFWYLFSPKFPKAFLASFRVKSFSFPAIKKLTTQGLPIGLQMVFESSAFSAATIMVGWIGANALAGHQIALSLAGTTYMMANGLGAAATVRVGNQLGLGNRGQMRKAGFTVYHIVIAFMAITGFTFYLLRDWLPGLFVDEPEVIAITSNILIITAFFQISDGIQVAGVSALRGMEDVKIPTLITFLAYWLVGLQVGYWLGVQGNMGVTGIWLGLLTGLTVAALLLTCRFHQKTKVNMA